MAQQMSLQQAFDLAAQCRAAGHRAEAESIYRQILAASPNQADALHNLGVFAMEAGDLKTAIDLMNRAISIQPNSANFHSSLGIALRSAGRIDDAIVSYRRAVSLDSRNASAWYNLGNALVQIDKLQEAIEAYQSAIRFKPDFTDGLYNLGNTYHQLGQFDRALAAYENALALKSDLTTVRYSISLIKLRQGDFASGLSSYECRWEVPGFGMVKPNFPQPMWDGGELHGRRIFIHAEQGLGDTMMIVRYVLLVKERGAGKIILACQPELARLLRCMPQIDAIITGSDSIPEFDVHCPLMSLPLACKTTLTTIPSEIPYLRADQDLIAKWRLRFDATSASDLKVGVVWAGRPSHVGDRNRSINLSLLALLGKVSGVKFFSLQKGKAAEQMASSPFGANLANWTSDLNDFADTAALVENLDLVIAVDTAVAHLAGAMGKPVWLLVPFVPDWRWLLERSDSPWYPTMRLFRQPSLEDWNTPIEQIGELLRKIASESAASFRSGR